MQALVLYKPNMIKGISYNVTRMTNIRNWKLDSGIFVSWDIQPIIEDKSQIFPELIYLFLI